jgi:hypothetical protein
MLCHFPMYLKESYLGCFIVHRVVKTYTNMYNLGYRGVLHRTENYFNTFSVLILVTKYNGCQLFIFHLVRFLFSNKEGFHFFNFHFLAVTLTGLTFRLFYIIQFSRMCTV